MIIHSESDMLSFGEEFAKSLTFPAIIELVGDVGAGKTTFTRGLARGLGIREPITSPSFTISKRYSFPVDQKCCKNYNNQDSQNTNKDNPTFGELIHYDFYRLDDPGLMSEDLLEAISDPLSVVVIEWGNDVSSMLPEPHYHLEFSLNPDGSRKIKNKFSEMELSDQINPSNLRLKGDK